MKHSIVVMWGLPGSGKTHYVREKYIENSDVKLVDSSGVLREGKAGGECAAIMAQDYCVEKEESTGEIVLSDMRIKSGPYVIPMSASRRIAKFNGTLMRNTALLNGTDTITFVVDTLCTAYDDFKTLMSMMMEYIDTASKIKVIAFDEDRQKCKANDFGRSELRDATAEFTIKNRKYEVPEPERLSEVISKTLFIPEGRIEIEVEKLPVVLKQLTDEEVFIKMAPDGILKSCSYSLGGVLRGTDGSFGGYIEPETMDNFTELDDMLEKICPALLFKDYRVIKEKLVKVVVTDDSDYYSESSSAHYEISLKELYDFLNDREIQFGISLAD